MRNLKRALSLALAAAMLISLMVVGASAASYGDADSIDNTDAVEFLSAIGVVGGDQNGNFNPDATLTRAEFCVMIANALTGGTFDRTLFEGTATPFTDVPNHWGQAYIAYCYSVGVIAGTSATTFSPDATLTAAQASAILLSALGYNQNGEFAQNGQFELNVTRWAQNAGLYDELSVSATAGITRDQTAKLVYNAMMVATPVVYSTLINAYSTEGYGSLTGVVLRGDTTYGSTDGFDYTLAHTVFSLEQGVTYMTGISYNEDNGKYTYSFESDGTAYMGPAVTPAAAAYDDTALSSTQDFSDLFGQKVNVIYKVNNTQREVYGIYGESDLVVSGVLGKITDTDGNGLAATDTDTTIKVGDAEYKLEKPAYNATATNAVVAFDYNDSAATETLAAAAASAGDYYTFNAYDSDADGRIDCIVYYPYTVSKVTYVGTSSITAGVSYAYDKDTGLYSNTSINYSFPEVVKGDYVLIPSNGVTGGVRDVTVVDVIEGKVTGEKTGSVQVNNTWYEKNSNTVSLNNTYKLYVANGYIFGADLVESASNDLLYVQSQDNATNLTGIKAKVMFADGTVEVIEISKLNGADVTSGNSVSTGALYTYTKNSDNTYEVKAVSTTNLAGNDAYVTTGLTTYTPATSTAAATLGTYAIADDAVIFLKSTANGTKYSVMTGAALKDYSTLTISSSASALVKAVNGAQTVMAAVIDTSNPIGSDTIWAYVTSDPYQVRYNDSTMNYATAWTGNGTVDVYTTSALTKGTVYALTANTDGTYAVDGSKTAIAVAITGYSESDQVITAVKASDADTYANNLKITDDTVILYVDSKNKAGVTGGELAVAQTASSGAQIANAYAYVNSGKLEAIVFDVNNDWNGAATAVGVTVTAPGTTTTGWSGSKGITITAMTADKTQAAVGDVITYTVTYSGTATDDATITFTAGTNSTVLGTSTVTIADETVVATGTTVTFKAVVSAATTVTEATVALS